MPLSEPLPDVAAPLRGGVPSVAPKIEQSQLDGVRVATLASVSPVSSIALVVAGGSSLESDATAGASKLVEAMAFKASQNRTTFRITRELEKIGANCVATAGRDHITFAVDATRLHVFEATEILLDCVLNARLQYHEVRDNMELAREVIAQHLANPACVLEDALHRVAFDGGLGQPLMADPKALTRETLAEFYAGMMQPSNMVLVGMGAGHDQLKGLAQPLLSAAHLGGKPAAAAPASKYVGGTSNIVDNDAELTHVGLAFEAKGGMADDKAAALASVAKHLLSSSGAIPYYSKLESGAAKSLGSFAHLYKSTGLVGLMGCSAPQKASALVDELTRKVVALASGVTEGQLAAAKQQAIMENKGLMASASTAAPIVASRVLAKGSADPASFNAACTSLTAAQVTSYIKDLAKSTPTLVTLGALAHLPRVGDISKRLA